jgi:chromosome segregation ATPase
LKLCFADSFLWVCRKRGADGDDETHIDDSDENNGGIDKQPTQASKKPKTDRSSGSADSGGQDRLKVLQDRIAEAKCDKDDAKHELDNANLRLAALKADINASKEDIQRAHDDVVRVDKRLTAAMETYKSAIDAETAAQTALAYNLANHIDPAFGQCIAFASNQNALIHSKSHNSSAVSPTPSSTPAPEPQAATRPAVTRIDRLVDADDVDDAQLLQVDGSLVE